MIVSNIYRILLLEYGPQGWWPIKGKYFPEEEDPFEIVVGAILTQNTSWKNAQRAILRLHEADLMDPQKIIALSDKKLTEIIKPSGYFNQKASRLKIISKYFIKWIKENRVPSREELLAINGIGPETADSILLYAFHKPVFVVDIYTRRLFSRVGITTEKVKYEKLQELIQKELLKENLNDEKIYREYHALIVEHAKRHCKKTPLCTGCIVNKKGICSYTNEN